MTHPLAREQEAFAGDLEREALAQDRKAAIAARHAEDNARCFWIAVINTRRQAALPPPKHWTDNINWSCFSEHRMWKRSLAWETRRVRAVSRAADCRRWARGSLSVSGPPAPGVPLA